MLLFDLFFYFWVAPCFPRSFWYYFVFFDDVLYCLLDVVEMLVCRGVLLFIFSVFFISVLISSIIVLFRRSYRACDSVLNLILFCCRGGGLWMIA